MTDAQLALRAWPAHRWLVALAAAAGTALLIGIPADLIDTPAFSRSVPPTWWSWPALLIAALLSGLLVATYARARQPDRAATRRGGWAGGALTFFAVGCPVCNKLVLLLLGTSGALTWFEPVQPLLQLVAVTLLGWALLVRLRGEVACPTSLSGGVPRA